MPCCATRQLMCRVLDRDRIRVSPSEPALCIPRATAPRGRATQTTPSVDTASVSIMGMQMAVGDRIRAVIGDRQADGCIRRYSPAIAVSS